MPHHTAPPNNRHQHPHGLQESAFAHTRPLAWCQNYQDNDLMIGWQDSLTHPGTYDRVSGYNGQSLVIEHTQALDLRGLGGNDFISGEQYDDRLDGGDGDDLIWGGAGNDVIWNTDAGSLADMADSFGSMQKNPGIGKTATSSIAANTVQKSANCRFECKFIWQRTPHSHRLQRHAQNHPNPNVHSMGFAGRDGRERPMGSAWRVL
jgi:hypothetical protein